ncbi:uncharacterized metal-binding protein YceD (DUF177 family) [Balneicella halophila]|uniref:Uncharacterized metal-binding protein YceD (DUF177 family) n=1 Tax=Balneicella halophila TaxID=1537566 RepID=A0A7L4UP61_BALHA|nr:DUF177 domain-containing protein [Balneicella halophila]PVX50908.1 uncharacterized metal-binding protein YceD (DUF177 family) [Balneicella halophila]
MKKQPYVIPFRTLSEGTHRYDFKLDTAFFESYHTLSEYSGEVEVTVVFFKQDSKKELTVSMEGTLETICDRCLDPLDLPFSVEGHYYLKEAEEGEEEKDDVVFVAPDDTHVELSQLFYELVMIGLPQKKTHQIENCNKEMLQKLEALEIKKEDKVDPRWATLEKLIKKEK